MNSYTMLVAAVHHQNYTNLYRKSHSYQLVQHGLPSTTYIILYPLSSVLHIVMTKALPLTQSMFQRTLPVMMMKMMVSGEW